MKGARNLYDVISKAVRLNVGSLANVSKEYSTGGDSRAYQYKNVIFRISTHARGKCFEIIIRDGRGERLDVYGIIAGNPGWTEEYGWIIEGPWRAYVDEYITDLECWISEAEGVVAQKLSEDKVTSDLLLSEKVDRFREVFMEVSV